MACCADRPNRYISKEVFEIPDLALRLEKIEGRPPDHPNFGFRCRECGQIWFEEWVGVMHASTTVVYKEGVDPDPMRDPGAPPPPPAKPWGQSPPSRLWRLLPLTVAIGVAMATGPKEDRRAIGDWRTLWLLAGLAGSVMVTVAQEREP